MDNVKRKPSKKLPHVKDSRENPKLFWIRSKVVISCFVILIAIAAGIFFYAGKHDAVKDLSPGDSVRTQSEPQSASNQLIERALMVSHRFHDVYTPCWEGAYGAIGDAYLYAVTKDYSLLKFHLLDHDIRNMCAGRWVDDRAWVCLAEFIWWEFTGRSNTQLVEDAKRRYLEARNEGRLSHHEGFWSWYNWHPASDMNEKIFTNSNMNQMVTVACRLFEATGDKQFLDDALLVWNGDKKFPGIEKTWYRGNGRWEGNGGQAAFGNQLPWEGTGYCSVAAALFRVTKDPKYKVIAVATVRRIMNPANGWVDPNDFYQIRMDGNGAFVNFLMDTYAIAADELPDLPGNITKMLDHVWTNGHGAGKIMLHRESDHAIRNGWNPFGGEDGYGVDEIGTVHAQGEAARAFGVVAYFAAFPGKH